VSTPASPDQAAVVPAATAIPTFPPTNTPTPITETPEANAVITATVALEPNTPEPTVEAETEATAEPVTPLESEAAATAALVELQPISDRGDLTGFVHQWQTWNNCGPATITMYTSYFSRPETQVEAAQFLKPNRDDKNVSPQELAAYARTLGLEVMVRQGGSLDQLKTFLSNGLPVLAETWLVHDGDGLGHYRLVTGYDDNSRQLNTFDSLNGPNYKASYEQFDSDWRVFNRLYLVVYTPEQAPLVATIIGEEMNDTAMHERLVQTAQAEIEANPNDAIAHFNHGDSLTQLGRYQEAVAAFDQARTLGLHWRRLWYQFTPFEAYYAVGRYQDVLDLADATIRNSGGLEEVYYYQGLALQATGQPGAAQAFEAAIAYNPNFAPAKEALENVSNP
jgi:tetratricopeptide (TPR) repeat protein